MYVPRWVFVSLVSCAALMTMAAALHLRYLGPVEVGSSGDALVWDTWRGRFCSVTRCIILDPASPLNAP